VGALVQANFGQRYQLTISGAPVGRHLTGDPVFTNGTSPFEQEHGSLIVVLATDAPLLPHQLKRLARRATLGMARTGALGGNGSGDLFLAFSTANPGAANPQPTNADAPQVALANLKALPNSEIDPLLAAAAYATEEAIINAMISAETMTGHNSLTVRALPHRELLDVLSQYRRRDPDPV
jgi:L-aminopeptidase/D-esterase-like protein